MVKANITGWGMYVPERVLTNAELERMVETSDEWIRTRTGIRERHIAGDEESSATMAVEAGRLALARANADPEEIDLVIVGTCTDSHILPSTAGVVQRDLGLRRAAAFDVDAACTGFIVGLSIASQFIENETYKRILVIGSDTISRIVDWTDRSTCVLFADGAGAAVIEAGKRGGTLGTYLRNDGNAADILRAPATTSAPSERRGESCTITMDGPEVFRFAVEAMVDATMQVLKRADLALGEVDLFIPHQANLRIIQAAARMLKLPMEKVYVNVDRYGNTSAASIPIALSELAEAGRLSPGNKVVLVAFGAGMSWGAAALEWTAPTPSPVTVQPRTIHASQPSRR